MLRSFLFLGLALWVALPSWGAQPIPATPANLPDLAAHTLIVFNKADPESQSLAETYAKARAIPADRVVGLECSLQEEISRAEFESTIRKPLEDLFQSRGWMKRSENFLANPILGLEGTVPVQQAKENPIWIMVLMRGMPLKIAEDPTILAPEGLMPQLRANAAAVDSELALLPIQGLPLYGLVANPYFADKRIRPFTSFFANYLILVTRLDGPSPGIVRRMIQDAVEAEKTELTGRAFFDLRSIEKKDDPYRLGDDWIDRAATLFRSAGFEVEIDRRPEVAPKFAPWDQIAFYAGWYTGEFQGPFEKTSRLTAVLDRVGSIPSSALDSIGDTSGGFGSAVAYGRKANNLYFTTDRGPGEGKIDYSPRLYSFLLPKTFESGTSPTFDLKFNPEQSFTAHLYKDPEGNAFTGLTPNADGTEPRLLDGRRCLDPEGLAVEETGNLYIAEEYYPSVVQFKPDGTYLGRWTPPENYLPRNPKTGNIDFREALDRKEGREDDHGFKGAALSPDGKTLYVLLQNGLAQDGGKEAGATRLLAFNTLTGAPQSEYAIRLENPASEEKKGKLPKTKYISLTELTFLPDGRLVAIESYNQGQAGSATPKPAVLSQIITLDLRGATDLFSLPDKPYSLRPSDPNFKKLDDRQDIQYVKTEILFSFESLGLPSKNLPREKLPEKWEGLAYLPGDQLLVVSDNDFLNPEITLGKKNIPFPSCQTPVDTWWFITKFRTERFRRGAIAYHIHSFSAETVRSETRNWVGPLLFHGATATMGAVYEPYLRFTPDISLFVSALLSGLSFAEAAYQSQLSLSWMVTMVGDPLYRPFPRNFYENLDAAQTADSPDLPWFRLRKVRLLGNTGALSETKTAVAKLVEDFPKNEIILEGGADIYRDLNEKKEAAELYDKALDLIGEREPRDRLRLLMKLAELNRRDDKPKEALKLYEKLMVEYPEASKSLGLGDRAVAFASGESLELPPALAKYKQEVEEAQIAAAVAKAATQPPAQSKPEATAADQAAVAKAASLRPAVSEPAMNGSLPSVPAPPSSATNSPTP